MAAEPATWLSVFDNLPDACSALSQYRLELFNDRNIVRMLSGQLLQACLREQNEAKSIRDLLMGLSPPSDQVREAMRVFCVANGLIGLLVPSLQADLGGLSRPGTPDSVKSSPRVRSLITTTLEHARRLPLPPGTKSHGPHSPDSAKPTGNPVLALPVRGSCYGRSNDLDSMSRILSSASTPTHFAIVGGGGMGKTSLANAVVHDDRVATAFQRRRYWVNLEGCLTKDSLTRSVLTTLPVPFESSFDNIRQFLATAKALLVLDDLDSLAAADEDSRDLVRVLDLLASCCCLIVTLRDARPLPTQMSWQKKVRLGPLDANSAQQTFCAVADAHAADPDLAGLIERCDGLPLAIRLLSRQTSAGEPLSVLQRRWDDKRHRLLSMQDPLTKLDSLAISIELTLDHPRLKTNEAAWNLLRLLAPVSGGLSLEQIESLLQATGDLSPLGSLLNLGVIVVQRTSSDQVSRYSILTPVRIYILDTVLCPPLSMVQDALRVLSPFEESNGLAPMRLFELTVCPLVPRSVDLLCIGVFPEEDLDKTASVHLNARCILASAKLPRNSTVSPIALVSNDGVIWHHTDITQGLRVPMFDTIATSLRHFRDQCSRRTAGMESFDPSFLRSTEQSSVPGNTTTGPPSPTLPSNHLDIRDGTIKGISCSPAEPTFLCFVLKPAPCEVVVELTPFEKEDGRKANLSSPLMREELAIAHAISSQARPRVTVRECDRICKYFSSCVKPIALDTVDEEGNGRNLDLALHSEEKSVMEELAIAQRQTVAAFAAALCIDKGQSFDAEKRLRAEAPRRVLPQDIDALVTSVAQLSMSEPNQFRAVRSTCLRISGRDGLTQWQHQILRLCEKCLDAVQRLNPSLFPTSLPPSNRVEDSTTPDDLHRPRFALWRRLLFRARQRQRRTLNEQT